MQMFVKFRSDGVGPWRASNWTSSGISWTTRITRTSPAWQRHSTSSWMNNMTKWTWRVNTSTKKSLRWQPPRRPWTPTPAHVSGRNGATGDSAVPLAEAECPPGTGLLRGKLSTAVNSAKVPPRMRNTAIKSPAVSWCLWTFLLQLIAVLVNFMT